MARKSLSVIINELLSKGTLEQRQILCELMDELTSNPNCYFLLDLYDKPEVMKHWKEAGSPTITEKTACQHGIDTTRREYIQSR